MSDRTSKFLAPSGLPEEARLDDLKRWLAHGHPDLRVKNDKEARTDMVMALRAATDHLYVELYVEADFLIRKVASTDYELLVLKEGEETFKTGRRQKWDEFDMEQINAYDKDTLNILVVQAGEEIAWLKYEMQRLNVAMDVAKRRKEQGDMRVYEFKTEPRP